MAKRIRQSASDFAVMALSPALIVTLLSSLVTFIILCLAGGQYAWRSSYVWFMFILGTVFIARLAIEANRAYTLLYSVILGLAAFFVLSRLTGSAVQSAGLSHAIHAMILALVWWLADRITFNCTLIDEDRDVSGRGLLDAPTAAMPQVPGQQSSGKQPRRRRRQRPGVSVLWLTAAALPIFGLGSVAASGVAGNSTVARYCLAIYLFSAMMLLVSTSFLGTRRYLRQRQVAMPNQVATAWLVAGGGLVVLLVATSFLLPVPGQWLAQSSDSQNRLTEKLVDASRWGWGDQTGRATSSGDAGRPEPSSESPSGDSAADSSADDAGTISGSESDRSDPNASATRPGETGSPQQDSKQGSSQADQQGQNGQPGSGDQQNQTDTQARDKTATDETNRSQTQETGQKQSQNQSEAGDDQAAQESTAADESSNSAPNSSAPNDPSPSNQAGSTPARPSPSPPSWSLPEIPIKPLLIVMLVVIVLAYLWWFRQAIAQWWRQLMAWLARRPPTAATAVPEPEMWVSEPPRPFASFAHPLTAKLPLRQAIIETFGAAEAWYREAGLPRLPQETPHDFARRLAGSDRRAAKVLPKLADAYGRMIYANSDAQPTDLQTVESVWLLFSQRRENNES